ncbi:SigE family RNA polymerase sigma factor [Frankia sp. CNm7]|uniref:SigE family RNA polymerase sigma factor n=1 Tax=Frankia nepalensis TaxID=1836974 RepID=A0A937UNV0_9ACTN|nr:SigE family RNA polymerase sigma factor [Frankia nepalensis]MBL7496617.1 SigE family RNA polymerase sigma factor [Frankia nepalensis]MBL7513360.1 SigE family RNA polymerase sigma factor [Frankia nepalensis]MBL7521619.1 SigE family RNA polymerase sigma factor [Frankia nepalensis]MBL7626625.1 SigE family RNA polymerase sigma factor [Frankia nepalensis]
MDTDDERAFEEFVARVANRLLSSAILLTGGDRAAAEDLVQGGFERAYLRWDKIDEGRREAYLRRAIVNGATSRWRRLRARVVEVPLQDHGSWPHDVAAVGVDLADRITQRESLIRALRALSPRQRAVVVLRYVEDLPEADVAATLGCSIGSVRSHASRGLARLRDSEHLDAVGPRTAAGPDILTDRDHHQRTPRLVTTKPEGDRL